MTSLPSKQTRGMTGRPGAWLWALLALTVVRWIVAAKAPLVPDESYYWIWSQVPQASYYDHPPMVALFIRAGTLLTGNNPLGIRFLGPAAIAASTLLLADAAERFQQNRQQVGLWTGCLFNATLMAGVGGILATPDLPQLFFWKIGRAHV